jgi:hypothetical protein
MSPAWCVSGCRRRGQRRQAGMDAGLASSYHNVPRIPRISPFRAIAQAALAVGERS